MSLVAVTGATGHLGACLVRQLVQQGHRVRALVRGEPGATILPPEVETQPGDVRDPEAMRRLATGAEVVYHLAAMISIVGPMNGLVEEINVGGARTTARAALEAGVRRFVHVCSVHAFQQHPIDQPLDEDRARVVPGKAPAYDVSKAAGEAEVRALIAQGLDAVIVHPSGVIGPFDYRPSRMGQVFLDLYHRRMPGLVAGGFDWVDVRDVCRGIQAAAAHGRVGESYLLSGTYKRMVELGALVQEITGARPPRMTSPMWLARMSAPFMHTWARVRRAEPLYTSEALVALRGNPCYVRAKAERELGHRPRPIEATIRDGYAWFAAQERLTAAPAELLPDAYGPVSVT
jgi:dihydroflavonol-4-reductase